MIDKKILIDMMAGGADPARAYSSGLSESFGRHTEKVLGIVKKKPALILAHIGRAFGKLTAESLQEYRSRLKEVGNGGQLALYPLTRLGFVNLCLTYISAVNYLGLLFYVAGQNEKTLDGYLSKVAELAQKRAAKVFPLVAGDIYENRTPVKYFTRPTDKATGRMMALSQADMEKGGASVLELHKGGAAPDVLTNLIFNKAVLTKQGVTLPDAFDAVVFLACLALKEGGRDTVTLAGVYRAMTGKSADKEPSENTKNAILESVRKWKYFPVIVDAREILKHYGHADAACWEEDSALPVRIKHYGRINGGQVETFLEFPYESAFMKLAKLKNNQLTTYKMELLDVPLNATRENMPIPHYLLGRIAAARSGALSKTIVFDNAITDLGYKGKRERFVESCRKCFDFWKKKKHISGFELVKRGRKVEAVKFTL